MADIWKAFSYDLIEKKNKKVDESIYHQTIETQLQLLGWAKYDGEINHKLDIPIGNHNFIQPDITIGKQPDWQFVIEVKRPNHNQQPKDVDQLTSYMRQLKLSVGLYIGEDIEVFYDTADAKESAKCVYRIELKLDKNPKGDKFVDLFSKQNFSKETLGRFCEECIKAQEKEDSLSRIKSYLMTEDGADEIKSYVLAGLQDKYSEQFSSDELAETIQGMTFSAAEATRQPKNFTKKQRNKKSSKSERGNLSIRVQINRNNLHAVGIFDGRGVTVLTGSPIAQKCTNSYDRKEWRDEIIKKHAHYLDGKLVMTEDLFFSTPSGASSFCLGSSSNGKRDWEDSNGQPLSTYMK